MVMRDFVFFCLFFVVNIMRIFDCVSFYFNFVRFEFKYVIVLNAAARVIGVSFNWPDEYQYILKWFYKLTHRQSVDTRYGDANYKKANKYFNRRQECEVFH